MDSEKILEIFKEAGAILEGHFLLTSGLHSPLYLEKFQVLQYPRYTSQLCAEIARRFKDDGVEVVVGPVTGGIILAYEVAKTLGVRSIFTERENGKMTLRRGFTIKPGERVLVVEDIVTTGGSVREVLEVIRAGQGEIIGVGLLVDRSGGKVDFGVRTEALLTLDVVAYHPDECPLCKQGLAITQRGSKGLENVASGTK